MKKTFYSFILFLFFFLQNTALSALPKSSVLGPHSQVDFLSSHEEFIPGEKIQIGFRFTMEEEWHIYWKNPGSSGARPIFDWQLPDGFSLGELSWPVPKRIPYPPLINFGYEEVAIFLQDIQTPKNLSLNQNFIFQVFIEWLICKETCIPGIGEVALTLKTASQSKLSPNNETLKNAQKYIPYKKLTLPLDISVRDQNGFLEINARDPKRTVQIQSMDFFPEEELLLDHGQYPLFETKGAHEATLKLKKNPNHRSPLEALKGLFIINNEAFEFNEKVTLQKILLQSLLFAFLGGLLLNLMPCVFPVLSLKILSFIGSAQKSREILFAHSLTYTLGIVLSFLALSSALILLRTFGEKLGWGFQLQSPEFLGFLILLFFGIGLNLLGIFEFGLLFTRLGNLGRGKSGYSESFFSGILAVIVATPCTAPFMGSAIGFALTQPLFISYLIFLSLALGMAFPYVLLSLFPSLLKFLPRPGVWMETFKQLLSFPLFATALWLLWVLGQQTGVDGMAASLASLLFFALGIWFFIKLNITPKKSKKYIFTIIFLILSFSMSFYLSFSLAPKFSGSSVINTSETSPWSPFSESTLLEAQNSGRPVFIDFTAAWCITCQVNKKLVLSTTPIQKAFEEKNVKLLMADWTNKNPVITEFLSRFNRQGVPVYLLYTSDPKTPPVILPEILTPQIVLDALNTLPAYRGQNE